MRRDPGAARPGPVWPGPALPGKEPVSTPWTRAHERLHGVLYGQPFTKAAESLTYQRFQYRTARVESPESPRRQSQSNLDASMPVGACCSDGSIERVYRPGRIWNEEGRSAPSEAIKAALIMMYRRLATSASFPLAGVLFCEQLSN